MSEAFEIVRRNVSKHHQHQKILYDEKVHGKPYKPGDWVWLHSPVIPRGSCCKLHLPWKGPYTIVKRYQILHTGCSIYRNGRTDKLSILTVCSHAPRTFVWKMQTPTNQTTSVPLAPTNTNPAEDIELVEGPEDDQSPAVASNAEPVQQQVRRYPTRDRRAPQRYSDYVPH